MIYVYLRTCYVLLNCAFNVVVVVLTSCITGNQSCTKVLVLEDVSSVILSYILTEFYSDTDS